MKDFGFLNLVHAATRAPDNKHNNTHPVAMMVENIEDLMHVSLELGIAEIRINDYIDVNCRCYFNLSYNFKLSILYKITAFQNNIDSFLLFV